MTNPLNLDRFQEFVNEGLDFDGVSGISCETVHPAMDAAMSEVNRNDWDVYEQLPTFDRQMLACLINELLPSLLMNEEVTQLNMDNGTDEVIVSMTGTHFANMLHLFASFSLYMQHAVGPKFVENPVLDDLRAKAQLMVDHILQTGDRPAFMDEVERALEKARNA